jgi:hypothetical protein
MKFTRKKRKVKYKPKAPWRPWPLADIGLSLMPTFLQKKYDVTKCKECQSAERESGSSRCKTCSSIYKEELKKGK